MRALIKKLLAATAINEHDKPFGLLGRCLYEKADKLEKEDRCSFRNQEQFLKSARGMALEKARRVFASVSINSPEYKIAQKYEQYIQLHLETSHDPGGSYCSHRNSKWIFKKR